MKVSKSPKTQQVKVRERFSPKQYQLLTDPLADINAIWGTSGSGKTFTANLLFYGLLMTRIAPGSLCLLSGVSGETIYNNVVGGNAGLLAIDRGIDALDYHGSKGGQVIYIKQRQIEVACVGAYSEGAEKRVQGMNCAFWYADEAARQPRRFVEMALGRCRLTIDGHMTVTPALWTFNADHPSHWIKSEYLDRADGQKIREMMFTFSDNPTVGKDYIDAQRTRYSGVYYDRMVLNKWTAAEGAVYSQFNREHHVRTRKPSEMADWILGVDFGWEHPMSVLSVGVDGDGAYHVFDEIYVKHQHIDKSLLAIAEGRGWPIGKYSVAYCDGARPEYVIQIGELFDVQSVAADKAVHEGISDVNRMLQIGGDGRPRLTVDPDCKNGIREFETYEWQAGRGGPKDEPMKRDDHWMDAIRYAVRSHLMYNQTMDAFSKLGPVVVG